jgi:hypothetical protein
MARHFARTGQPSKDCDWGNDVLAELFPNANPIWRDVDAAEDVVIDITNAWAMVIGKVGVVDALGGVVEADTFLSLRKRGSPPAQYWEKYDGEHVVPRLRVPSVRSTVGRRSVTLARYFLLWTLFPTRHFSQRDTFPQRATKERITV